jgi:hypothetical protein
LAQKQLHRFWPQTWAIPGSSSCSLPEERRCLSLTAAYHCVRVIGEAAAAAVAAALGNAVFDVSGVRFAGCR